MNPEIFTAGYWAACPGVSFDDLPLGQLLRNTILAKAQILCTGIGTLDELPKSMQSLVALCRGVQRELACTARESGQVMAAAGRLAAITSDKVKRDLLISRELWCGAMQRAIVTGFWSPESDLEAYAKGISSVLPLARRIVLRIGDANGRYVCTYLKDGSSAIHLDCIGVWGLGVEGGRAVERHELGHAERSELNEKLYAVFNCQTEEEKGRVRAAANLWKDVQVNTVSVATAKSTQAGIALVYGHGWVPQALIGYKQNPILSAEIQIRAMARALGCEKEIPFPPSQGFEEWWQQKQSAVHALASEETLPISQGFYDYHEEAARKEHFLDRTAHAIHEILGSLAHLPHPPPLQGGAGNGAIGPKSGGQNQPAVGPTPQGDATRANPPSGAPASLPQSPGSAQQPGTGKTPVRSAPVKAADLLPSTVILPIGAMSPDRMPPELQEQLKRAAELENLRETDAAGSLIRLGMACRTGYHIRYPLGPLDKLSARYRPQENAIRRRLEKLRKNALTHSEDYSQLTNTGEMVHNPQLAKALLVDPDIENYWLQAPPDKLINKATFLFVLDVSDSMTKGRLVSITPMCIAMLQAMEKAGFRTGLGCFSDQSGMIYSPRESSQIKREKMTKILLSGEANDVDAIFQAAKPITGGDTLAVGTTAAKAYETVNTMIASIKRESPGSLHVLYYTDGEWSDPAGFTKAKLPHVTHTVCCYPSVHSEVSKIFGDENCVKISTNSRFMEIAWDCLYKAVLREGGLLDGTTARAKFTRATRAAVQQQSHVDYRWNER